MCDPPKFVGNVMEESYKIRINDLTPRVKFKVTTEMLEDLKKRAHQNGRDFNIEVMMRLARTLERDTYRDECDQNYEKIFFVNDDDQAVT